MKRDIQGKFALKNDDYRLVRSLRLTDETWKALGITAECEGLTRADYLEQIVRDRLLPNITPGKTKSYQVLHGKKKSHLSVLHRRRSIILKVQQPHHPK